MRKTLVWRGVDVPRMEIAHVELENGGLRARGTQIGIAYELRYDVDEPRLRLELVGERTLELELEHGRDHFDLGYSPLFNTLPLLDGLDAPREFVMTWVSVPDLVVGRSEQRYEPLAPGVVRYRGTHRRESPHFDLEVDEDGFVIRYPTLAERLT